MILRYRPEGRARWTVLANCPTTKDATAMLVKFREDITQASGKDDVELECLADDGSLAAHLRMERGDWIDHTGAPVQGSHSMALDDEFEGLHALSRTIEGSSEAVKQLAQPTRKAADAMKALGVALEEWDEKKKRGSKKERKAAKKRRKEAERQTKAAKSWADKQIRQMLGPTYTIQMTDPHGGVHEACGVQPESDGSAEIEFPGGFTASLPPGTLDPGPPKAE